MLTNKKFQYALALCGAGMCAGLAQAALAQAAGSAEAQPAPPADTSAGAQILVTAKPTRSATAVTGAEMQKILPGVGPLKAIETLPGVLYITADPWGYNEQNAQIFVHGFNYQQLGYTMDGVPLGDQSYGNYNGLSPERAVISEDVSRSVVSTGAGDLGTASTSNLGGAIEVFSADPSAHMGLEGAETVGSYNTSRTYVRLDSGDLGSLGGIGGSNRFYIAAAHQSARAWDFDGYQGGWQANAKFLHDGSAGKLTLYFDYSQMTQPNEDATSFFIPSAGKTATAAQLYTPYTRPYLFPDFSGMRNYMDAYGNTPGSQGGNYHDYYSEAERLDYLGYIKYDAHLGSRITWSNQAYFHHDDGVGVVDGPLGQSITVVQAYLDPNYATDTHYKGNANASQALVAATGGSGLVTRTTEYRIDREGLISNLNLDLGAHKVQLGGWYEANSATQYRRWYGVNVDTPADYSPYVLPTDPLFTQYRGEARIADLQFHLQDDWTVNSRLAVEAGFKTSSQWANGWYPVQPVAGSLSGLSASGLPQGRIDTSRWFLPAAGARYKLTQAEELYLNVQKNLRQYMDYLGGGGLSPWGTGSQAAFDAFAANGRPEESWTYEIGARTHRHFSGGLLSAIDAQVNYYHVVFDNRQLAINTNPGGIAGSGITGGTSILVNVGSVHTDGVDAAFTLHFGHGLRLYNATSYNSSTYRSDYTSTASGIGAATGTCIGGATVQNGVVPTCGKQIPGSPRWMNKTVATLDAGPFEAQLIGDYVGQRYATYVNDTGVPSYFLTSLRIAAQVPTALIPVRKAEISLNVTNLGDIRGWSTLSIGSATNSFAAYPIAPRQWFLTLDVGL